ncbi:MAG: hypothetical protein MUC88_00375 [Planctomycetes bacterium]|jgi:hypothetical protein|nr:hypothetical protein [Planctomycetota bacterium]
MTNRELAAAILDAIFKDAPERVTEMLDVEWRERHHGVSRLPSRADRLAALLREWRRTPFFEDRARWERWATEFGCRVDAELGHATADELERMISALPSAVGPRPDGYVDVPMVVRLPDALARKLQLGQHSGILDQHMQDRVGRQLDETDEQFRERLLRVGKSITIGSEMGSWVDPTDGIPKRRP